MNGKDKFPNCWTCNDHGIVFFNKKINGIEYEFGAKCKCKLGQQSSDKIGTIENGLAEYMAEENFTRFKKVYPDLVIDLVG